MLEPRQLKVFLCHSSKDKPAVRELYQKLCAESWIDPWLDEEKLFPGQNWQIEIPRAVRDSDVVLVCLSDASVNKEGYVQKELRFALDVALEKLEDTIFIIPIRLDECKTPSSLAQWHYVDYFPVERRNRAFERLLTSLKMRAKSLGISINQFPAQAVALASRNPLSAEILTMEGVEFCRISAGEFVMGSGETEAQTDSNENPEHIVRIPYDFWLGRYPITNEQYSAFVKAKNISHPVVDWEKIPDHPVVNVSWENAAEYCRWMNVQWQQMLAQPTLSVDVHLTNLALRLPTEAEWEKAARGISSNLYPWGNHFDSRRLTFQHNSFGRTAPVYSFPNSASPYGCEQMAGNVWEWTHSLFAKYPYKADDGRENEQESGSRVMRGGAYNCDKHLVRCATRFRSPMNFCRDSLGFRVCLAPSLEP